MLNKYDVGFITIRNNEYIASCGCGTIKLLGHLSYREYEYLKNTTCDGCGNKNFVKMGNKKRVLFPYIDVIEKNRKGFKVKRTNLSVFHDNDYNVCVKENMVQVLIYNLVNHKVHLYKKWGNSQTK